MPKESSEEMADRLMAPASPAALWTYDQVRMLLIEAAESAPLSTGERREARAALRMIRDAIGEMFGPLAPMPDDERLITYAQEAEAIIAGLQRVATRLRELEEAPKP